MNLTYERICRVLGFYFGDPFFVPKRETVPPDDQKEKVHVKIYRVDSCVDWRCRVWKALRTQNEIYLWEGPWRRRYMTEHERFKFWVLYWESKGSADEAMKKIDRNFERWGVYWE